MRGVLLVIIILIVIAAPFAVSALVAATAVRSAEAASNLAVADVKNLDFAGARSELGKTNSSLGRARTAVRVLKVFAWVPWLGTQITATDHTIAAAIETTVALDDALGFAADLVSFVGNAGTAAEVNPVALLGPDRNLADLSREERRSILAKLAGAGASFDSIETKLKLAEAELAKIPESGVSSALREAIGPFEVKVRETADALAQIRPLAKTLPGVAGYPDPKTYLFFLANNTELRPGGGFLGSYGILKMADGDIASIASNDIYTLDFPAQGKVTTPAPVPITKYLGIDKMYLRDSNWSPDFPESAKMAMSLYAEEAAAAGLAPDKLDGVIVITPDVAVDLLRIVGPITVRDVTFRPDNLVQELEYQVEQVYLQTGTPFLERKGIMGELMQELLRKLTALPVSRWSEVTTALQVQLSRKQALFYDRDPALEQAFVEQDWAGLVKPSDGSDYLMVVDANLGGLKTDSVMDRSIKYALAPGQGGRLDSVVEVTYKNNGSFTPYTSRYRTYTRFYVPEGSELVAATGQLENDKTKNPKLLPGQVDVSSELGKTVFGMFTSIEPGETRKLVVRYRLPTRLTPPATGGAYGLLVQKQAGSADYPLTLDLRFGNKVRRAAPPEDQKFWSDDRYYYSSDLSRDRAFSVGF